MRKPTKKRTGDSLMCAHCGRKFELAVWDEAAWAAIVAAFEAHACPNRAAFFERLQRLRAS
jgi:hypothetical protein